MTDRRTGIRSLTTSTLIEATIVGIIVVVCMLLVVGIGVLFDPPPLLAQRANFRDSINCDLAVAVSMNTATTTEFVALTAAQRVHVCGFALSGGGATTAKFVRGTGANCGTGTADVTAPFELGDNTSIAYGNGVGTIFRLPAGSALCITNSAALQLSGVITYAKF